MTVFKYSREDTFDADATADYDDVFLLIICFRCNSTMKNRCETFKLNYPNVMVRHFE